MEFAYSEKVNGLLKRVNDFMDRYIYPNEQTFHAQIAASGNPHHHAQPGICSPGGGDGPRKLGFRGI